ncbi:MAG: zinc-binding dehydrogenase [Dehalococcoidia bacterium]|nr:zinc-binding dehydrogenase [Dehalococcoidia bacterium]
MAARLHAPSSPLLIEEVPVPTPSPGEALVRVLAAGVCGSDRHMFRGQLPVANTPIVLGHEIAGTVEAIGPGVQGVEPGQAVIVRPGIPCGRCRACQAGDDNLCPQQKVLGVSEDGGFAQYVRAPMDTLVPLPEGIPFEVGAILADAVATPYHALVVRGRLKEGERVLIIGPGGVGLHAVLLARALGADVVVASDVRPQALQRAGEMGAHHTILASETLHNEVQHLMGGVDLALDCVGQRETLMEAVRSLRPGGRAVIVGMG